jgi:hypothetical protein
MKMITWAAIVATGLFALMNLGVVADGDIDTGWRITGVILGLLGALAAVGLGAGQPWGRSAVIAVGAANTTASIIGLVADQQGAAIGIVVGAAGVILGCLTPTSARRLIGT